MRIFATEKRLMLRIAEVSDRRIFELFSTNAG